MSDSRFVTYQLAHPHNHLIVIPILYISKWVHSLNDLRTAQLTSEVVEPRFKQGNSNCMSAISHYAISGELGAVAQEKDIWGKKSFTKEIFKANVGCVYPFSPLFTLSQNFSADLCYSSRLFEAGLGFFWEMSNLQRLVLEPDQESPLIFGLQIQI